MASNGSSTATNSHVKVCVRCRPFLPQEKGSANCVQLFEKNNRITIGERSFTFDNVFASNLSQSSLFHQTAKYLVEGCMEGYNASMMAYGQTGSGKTFSMIGSSLLSIDDNEDDGIIPRSIRHLFARISELKANGSIANIRVSFLEIYNEELKDLLHPEILSREIMIREDKDGKIFFTGAREEPVNSCKEAFLFLERGNIARTTAETLMNVNSSRSHAIFTISTEIFVPSIQYEELKSDHGEEEVRATAMGGSYIHSKFSIVDLAGSERAKRTGAGGLRLKESVGINQGLLALGKVIRALTTSSTSSHIPYRESKLTRYLQDSLGGNSRTCILACISPSELNLHETLSTLQYASRARSVQNKVIANISIAPAMLLESENETENNIIGALRAQIQTMNKEINALKLIAHDPILNSKLDGLSNSIDFRSYKMNSMNTIENVILEAKVCHKLLSESLQSIGWNEREMTKDSYAKVRDLVITSRDVLVRLEAIISNPIATTTTTNINTNIKDVMIANKEKVDKLQQELLECKEDLRRDEEIFAEKVRELKASRKQVKQLQRENMEMKQNLEDWKQKFQQVALLKVNCNSYPIGVTNGFNGIESQSSQSSQFQLQKDLTAEELEISIAVAATEPDISQLMEDLEVVSKEKDYFIAIKEESELKYRKALQVVDQQRIEFENIQRSLLQKIKSMEDLLTHQSEDVNSILIHEHQHHIQALEQEREALRNQIASLNRWTQSSAKEVDEERELRRKYEAELEVAESKLLVLQKQVEEQDVLVNGTPSRSKMNSPKYDSLVAPSSAEAKSTSSPLSSSAKLLRSSLDEKSYSPRASLELLELRREYQQLNVMYLENQTSQRQQLYELSQELEAYKSTDQQFQQQLSDIETKNRNLKSKLSKLLEVKGYKDVSNMNLMNSIDSIISLSPFTRSQYSDDYIISLIHKKLEVYIQIYDSIVLILDIQEKIHIFHDDQMKLKQELQPLLQKQIDFEYPIRQQMKQLKSKMKSLKSKIQSLEKEHLKKGSSEDSMFQDLLFELKAYQEKYDELESKHQQNRIDPKYLTLLDNMQDYKEDIENIDIQLQVMEKQLEMERNSLKDHTSVILQDNRPSLQTEELFSLIQEALRRLQSTSSKDIQLDFSTLFQEVIQRDMSYHIHDQQLVRVMTFFLISVLYHQSQSRQWQQAHHKVQSLLLETTQRNEELAHNYQSKFQELQRKQENANAESNEKIEYLLQQLKLSELKVNQILSNKHLEMISQGIFDISQSNNTISSRPSTTSSMRSMRVSGERKIAVSDEEIQRSNANDGSFSQEIIRRWNSEKERRAMLEKKNKELMKEIRRLKNINSDMEV